MSATVQRKGDSYRVAVHLHGQRKYISAKTKKAAEAIAHAVKKQEMQGTNVIDAVTQARRAPTTSTFPTLKDAVTAWITARVSGGDLRHSTGKLYRNRCNTWLFRTLGDRPVNEITREAIGEVITAIKVAGKSTATLNQVIHPLRKTYTDLIERKLLRGPNPAADLKHFIGRMPRPKSTHDKFYTGPQSHRLIEAAKALKPRWVPFLMTSLLGGLRWGEAAALQVTDVDFRRHRVSVTKGVSENGRVELTKTHLWRTVKMSPALEAVLKKQVETVSLEGSLHPTWTPEQKSLLFPNKVGHVGHYPSFHTHVWKPLVKAAKLPYKTPHAQRHTFATLLLEDGADPRYVQKLLGHSSIKITSDTYGHVMDETHEQKQSLSRLDALVMAH